MNKVLCYGDSNTYGFDPRNGLRYPEELRWASILAKLLGSAYEVIPEGLNGRTTAFDRDGSDDRTGLVHFRSIYNAHEPIDILIFMLGTNDCIADLGLSVEEIAGGMERLLTQAIDNAAEKQGSIPEIVLVTPAAIGKNYRNSVFSYQLDAESYQKSHELGARYKALSEKYGCLYLDASKLLVSPRDSEHLTVQSHRKLAGMLFETIMK